MSEETINKIITGLNGTLPGYHAQLRMAPKGRDFTSAPSTGKVAGVLLLLYPVDNKLKIVFIKRVTYPGVHSNQVAFPGGMMEETDIDSRATALRETMEEVGADPDKIRILGKLSSLFIPVSKILVEPYVGYTDTRPEWSIDSREVDYTIEEDINILLDPTNRKEEEWILEEQTIRVPFYAVQNEKIWGATAMILSEFLELVKRG